MRSEILISDSSFSWLAREVFRSREAAPIRKAAPIREATPVREVPRLQPQRLPADFSADEAALKGRQLQALKMGELLGSGARAVSKAVSAVAGRLLGRAGTDADANDTAPEQTRVFDKAA